MGLFIEKLLCSRLKLGYCGGAGTCGDSSGTDGGIFGWLRKSRLILGGLVLLSEFDLATFDVFGRTTPFCIGWVIGLVDIGLETVATEEALWSPRTIVFKSNISVGVISEGSTKGKGRFVDFSI